MSCRRSATLHAYRRFESRRFLVIGLLLILLVMTAVLALISGAASLPPEEALAALFGGSEQAQLIVWQLRLPRVCMAILVGVGLASGGAACQAVLKNPLASPFTLGVASGAAFGAVLVIMLVDQSAVGLTASAAFAGALLCALLILAIGRLRGTSPEILILAGVALMFFFSAVTSLLQYTGSMEQLAAVVFWLFGSLSKVGWREVGITALLVLPAAGWLLARSWDFNLLLGGDDGARALGVNVERLRFRAILAAALMCAGSICFTGVIGFVGLVAPHLGRMLLGSDHRFLFPASALLGALLVLVADTLGRTLWAPLVFPLGIMTSFIGVPFFMYLLLRRKGHRQC